MSRSRVSLASCRDYTHAAVLTAVRRALAPFGGMDHFVKPGHTVLIKPNLLTPLPPEKGATTHPSLVGSVAQLVKEAGGKPVVGDSPGIHSLEKVSRAAGIARLGLPAADFKNVDEVSQPAGMLCKKFVLARAVKNADLIINLPKLKTHGQMTMTAAVKNMFGCVQGMRKGQFHLRMQKKEHFALMLLDLYGLVKPVLSIVDAIEAMEGNGPSGGDIRHLGLIAAAEDAFSLDTVLAGIIGLNVDQIPYLKAAREKNIGCTDIGSIDIIGDPIAQFKVNDFKMPLMYDDMRFDLPVPQWMLRKWLTPRPVIDKHICKKCYECVKICPAAPKALSSKTSEVPVFDYTTCIRCFCCQEICPHRSIYIKKPFLSRLIG